jgi:dienelactone hydrolase
MKRLIVFVLVMVFTRSAIAGVETRDITYLIGEDEFTGYLAYDNTVSGKRPGVLVVHEWWGLGEYEKHRARMLAESGYVAFVVDMYGTGRLTDQPDQARSWMQEVTADVEWWRERALKGVEILKQHERVDAGRIAAIGYCFGGGTVLQLAYGGADIDGVVSFHGSLPAADEETADKIKARILVAHGNADEYIARETITKFQDRLDQAQADWRMITYGNVRHSFTNPGADARGIPALKYDAGADRHSWRAMQEFFGEIF